MLPNLDLSFLTWTSWYQVQTLPPRIIENSILYFCLTFPNKAKKLKYSTTDIQIKMHFSVGIPANTQAYAVIISDRLINFQSDGNKFSVVF